MNRVVLVAGVAAATAGILAIVEPDVLAGFSLPSVLVVVIGALALLESLRAGHSRFVRDDDAPEPPEPERRQVATVPGDDFDARLATVTGRGRVGGARDRDRVRDRLTEVAVEVLVRYDGDTPEKARERLRKGTWSDDRAAAGFFPPLDAVQPSLADRIRLTMTSDVAFRWQARRAIAALAARVEGSDEH